MRSHFQLVWESSTVWAFPLPPGMEIDYWAFLLSAGTEIDYKLCVPTLWETFTVWAFPLSSGMEIGYKLGVPTFNWYGNQLQTLRVGWVGLFEYVAGFICDDLRIASVPWKRSGGP